MRELITSHKLLARSFVRGSKFQPRELEGRTLLLPPPTSGPPVRTGAPASTADNQGRFVNGGPLFMFTWRARSLLFLHGTQEAYVAMVLTPSQSAAGWQVRVQRGSGTLAPALEDAPSVVPTFHAPSSCWILTLIPCAPHYSLISFPHEKNIRRSTREARHTTTTRRRASPRGILRAVGHP